MHNLFPLTFPPMTRLPVFGNILSEVVDCGSDQGRSVFATGGVAALRRGWRKRENAGLGRKMPLLKGC